MTAKETAEELRWKFYQITPSQVSLGTEKTLVTECAKITVDEILSFQINTMKWSEEHNGNIHFWQEVKQELEKI